MKPVRKKKMAEEPVSIPVTAVDKKDRPAKLRGIQDKLRLAEEFIKDLGVQSHYEKFLADRIADVGFSKTERGESVESFPLHDLNLDSGSDAEDP